MAGFRRFRRKRPMFRRRVRSRVDVVPWSLCGGSIVVPTPANPDFWTCARPFIDAQRIISGGARNYILREAANAALAFDTYYAQQGMERGLTFLGARFRHVISYAGNPYVDFAVGAAAVWKTRIACALVVLEEATPASPGIPAPTTLPNLFSADELQANDILYRWENDLVFQQGDGTSYTIGPYLTDTSGALAANVCYGEGSCSPAIIQVPRQQVQHVTRNKRFLDETHGIYLVTCIQQPYSQSVEYTLGLNIFGLMKVRGAR